jgi:hypothetical protein
MNAMPNLETDYSNPEDEVIELIRSYNVRYKNNLKQVAPKVVPILAENRHLIYAMTRVFSRWLQERDDEAAGQIGCAQLGQDAFARSSSPNADGKGQPSLASNGHGQSALPSATERDDEATVAAPANPGQSATASSSLHVRERGGHIQSAGNGPSGLASPAREPSVAYLRAKERNLRQSLQTAAQTEMDTFMLRTGRGIGDHRFGELEKLEVNNAVEAAVIRRVRNIGANIDPSKKVREELKPAELRKFIAEAQREVRDAA